MEEEVILNKIIQEANEEANKIIEEAKKEAYEIEKKQEQQIIQKLKTDLEIIEIEIKRNKETEIEKAELESRIAILEKKHEKIKIVKDQVKQKLRNLSVKEFCEIYKEIISQFSNKNNLEVLVQEKNKNEISKELKSFGVQVSEEAVDFNYGIIIKDGKIEYNHCFEEIMEFNNDKIEKAIANILFS